MSKPATGSVRTAAGRLLPEPFVGLVDRPGKVGGHLGFQDLLLDLCADLDHGFGVDDVELLFEPGDGRRQPVVGDEPVKGGGGDGKPPGHRKAHPVGHLADIGVLFPDGFDAVAGDLKDAEIGLVVVQGVFLDLRRRDDPLFGLYLAVNLFQAAVEPGKPPVAHVLQALNHPGAVKDRAHGLGLDVRQAENGLPPELRPGPGRRDFTRRPSPGL